MPPAVALGATTDDTAAGYIEDVITTLRALDPAAVQRVAETLLTVHGRGGAVFLCGNGGSAATASHMAADLAKGAPVGAVTGLRTFALTDSVPLLTAWGNDFSYERVFSEQVRNLVRAGDALVALSASGNSPNILLAVEQARAQGAVTIGLCGFGGGRLVALADVAIVVASHDYGAVEDAHLVLNHAVAACVRAALRSSPPRRPVDA